MNLNVYNKIENDTALSAILTTLSTSTLSNSIITKHCKTLLTVVALYSFIQKGKTWTACFYPFLLNQLYNKTQTQKKT